MQVVKERCRKEWALLEGLAAFGKQMGAEQEVACDEKHVHFEHSALVVADPQAGQWAVAAMARTKRPRY